MSQMPLDLSILFNLFLSVLLGGIIGLEREYHEKPAGFRTNILICLGAAIFTVISLAIGERYNQDPARISAQIVTGVGFLGAGAIMREGLKVSGLTTAAGIWLISAIGMACGYGYYDLAFGGTALVLLAQLLLVKFERVFRRMARRQSILLTCKAEWNILQGVEETIVRTGGAVEYRSVTKQGGNFSVEYTISGSEAEMAKTVNALLDMPSVETLQY